MLLFLCRGFYYSEAKNMNARDNKQSYIVAKEEEEALSVPFKCQEGREQNVLVAERQRATARIVFSSHDDAS